MLGFWLTLISVIFNLTAFSVACIGHSWGTVDTSWLEEVPHNLAADDIAYMVLQLQNTLEVVADRLHQNGQDIRIVVVGGVVSIVSSYLVVGNGADNQQ